MRLATSTPLSDALSAASHDGSRAPHRARLPLADAFLALSDDGLPAAQRTLPRVVAATAAAVVLALGVPLGWYLVPRAAHPVAALSSKTALADSDE